MRAWQVIRLGTRRIHGEDHRVEIVAVLRSDSHGDGLEVGDRLRQAPRRHPRDCPLTPRQLEILQHLAAGLTYKQIAATAGVSPATVRTHIHKAYSKLGVVDRAQAVLRAVDEGWI